ncbi:mitochondrial import inner membrane translocase subunit TIM16 [Trichonephila clavata]|uniref:Mitochondrial import inner membrane translocase subunit TIM16 n=1 Tax=Trichonephila clavata TaxID=2740835 RepID=A0A8X6GUV0_TRICU|nr:mitochondrial import inner membrane translocase subunit TIM16 [Trichonephila clavata]
MAKFVTQIIVLGAQVVSRAFARALRQEYAATQAAAQKGQGGPKAQAEANLKVGMNLDEAKNILNVHRLDAEEIEKSFNHLFKANDRSSGGSLYLQSKVFRAKERLDEELRLQKQDKEKAATSLSAAPYRWYTNREGGI